MHRRAVVLADFDQMQEAPEAGDREFLARTSPPPERPLRRRESAGEAGREDSGAEGAREEVISRGP